MNAYQQFLNYASERGLSPDVAFCYFTVFSEIFGAAIVLIARLLFHLFRKLKLHFQKPRPTSSDDFIGSESALV